MCPPKTTGTREALSLWGFSQRTKGISPISVVSPGCLYGSRNPACPLQRPSWSVWNRGAQGKAWGMAFPRSLQSRSWAAPFTQTQTQALTPSSPRTPGSARVTWQPLWGSYSPRHGELQTGFSCARPLPLCPRQAGEKGSVRAKLGCTGRQGKARGALGKGNSRENSVGA